MNPYDETILQWYKGKRVLLTGGAGFIAAGVIGLLRSVDCTVVRLLHRDTPAWADPGLARIEDLTGDVRDPGIWRQLPDGMDAVFHLAAQTSTYDANRDPRSDLDSNVLPVLMMLQACRDRDLQPAIVLASTATVCGLPLKLPVDEEHPDKPVTIYDLHKQMAENYLKYFCNDGSVRGAVLRLANVYGPGPRSSRADRGILNQMVAKAVRGDPLTVYGSGEQLRDYVHVQDVAKAFLAAAANMDALSGRHYIIGRGEGHSIAQALRMVAERVAVRSGKSVPVTNVPPPAGLSPIEARNFVADTRRFTSATGWRAEIPLSKGIDTIIESLS